MAKKLSRAKRKQEREKQKRVLARRGKSTHKSNRELEREYKRIITQEREEQQRKQRKREKYNNAQKLQDWKKKTLLSLGFEESQLKTTYLRKVKKTDIEKYQAQVLKSMESGQEVKDSNPLSRERYPFLYTEYNFDYDKVYYVPNGKGFYFAWLDYFGENTIEDLLFQFMGLDITTLIEHLDAIVHTPPSARKEKGKWVTGSSSGRAGSFRQMVCDESTAKMMFNEDNKNIRTRIYNEKKHRYHTGNNREYQLLTSGHGYTIKETTGREILIILNAIFYNVTEGTRELYSTTYSNIIRNIPEFKIFLPKP